MLKSAGISIVPAPVPARNAESLADAGGESREEILKKVENPPEVHPLLAQKLSSSFQVPTTKTEHTMENITESKTEVAPLKSKIPKVDPYRELPE